MSPHLEPGLISRIDSFDGLVFLSDVEIDHSDDNNNNNNDSVLSYRSQDGIETLGRIVESLQKDHIPITERIVMSKRVWESNLYAEGVTSFPIAHVSTKCDVMSKIIELLRYNTLLEDDDCVAVLKQLRWTLEETAGSTKPRNTLPTTVNSSEGRSSSANQSQSRIDRHFKRLSIDSHRLSNAFSLSRQRKPQLFSTKSMRSTSTADLHKEEEMENYSKFWLYKQLMTILYQEFCQRSGDHLMNDPLFVDVSDTICHLVQQDCKKLLMDYIERRIMV